MGTLTLFQVLGLTAAAVIILVLAHSLRRGRLPGRVATAWIAVWISAAILIARPELSSVIGRALGIGRGADFIFYVAILSGLYGFLTVLLRQRRLRSEITALTRELTLLRAEMQERHSSEPFASGEAGVHPPEE